MTYTQGPWVIDKSHPELERNVVWAGDKIIAHVVDDQHDNADANARLIANAPSLVDALAQCVNWLGTLSNCKASDACVDSVRGLLFHVTGNGHYTPKEVSDG